MRKKNVPSPLLTNNILLQKTNPGEIAFKYNITLKPRLIQTDHPSLPQFLARNKKIKYKPKYLYGILLFKPWVLLYRM
jgi:hypothetical protein